MGLNPILSIPSLSSFIITQSTKIILENSFKICSTQLQTLNLSGIDGTAIDDVWFLQTLKQIRSTIECLTLANTSISGEILIEFNETLPCLKSLNLSYCKLSMLLYVSAMPSLARTGEIMSKIWPFSRIFVKIDLSYFLKKFLIMPSDPLEKLYRPLKIAGDLGEFVSSF